jgi:hypothetical protein
MRRLATTVVLTSATGGTVTYRAGSVPAADVAARITNPDAWVSDPVDDVDQPTQVMSIVDRPNPPAAGAARTPDPGPGEEPARNARTEAWRAFAEGLGQTVPEDAGREDIIAQLVHAGLIGE